MNNLLNSQIVIEQKPIANLLTDKSLMQDIWNLVAPSYVDATAVLERDIKQCDRIYLAKDEHNILCSFFMVGWDKITIQGKEAPAVYLGLSATSVKTKNTGIIRLLFSIFFNDAQQWEKSNQKKLILWHTTASPSIFHAFNTLLDHNEPCSDGSYTEEGKEVGLAVRQKKGWHQHYHDHPFVLYGVAYNTLYSTEECLRIEKICREKKFTLFEQLGINERNGDRLLRISYLP